MNQTETEGFTPLIDPPEPARWVFDQAHSDMSFVARHLMVTKVRGRFDQFSGHIDIAERPEDSSVEVTIDAASIDTKTADRDTHLKSNDFLNVEQYPQITFKSTNVELTGGTGLRVTGDLTIRDVTKPITLEGEYLGTVKTPWGGDVIAFTATTELEREDWGVSWNVALETGGWLVSKKIRLELEVEAARETEQAEAEAAAESESPGDAPA